MSFFLFSKKIFPFTVISLSFNLASYADNLYHLNNSNNLNLSSDINPKMQKFVYLGNSITGDVATCSVDENNVFTNCIDIKSDASSGNEVSFINAKDIVEYNGFLYVAKDTENGSVNVYKINQESGSLTLVDKIKGYRRPTGLALRGNQIFITEYDKNESNVSYSTIQENGLFKNSANRIYGIGSYKHYNIKFYKN